MVFSLFLVTSEGDVRNSGLPASGPIRPSLPWCLGAATRSSHRSCAGRKPAARGREQVRSWQCRKAGKVMVFSYSFESLQKVTLGTLGCRPRARSILRCHGDLVLRHGPLTAVARARSVLRCLTSNKERKEKISDVWHSGLPAAAMVLWCSTRSSHRSCAGRKPGARGREQVRSWQCRKAGKVMVFS